MFYSKWRERCTSEDKPLLRYLRDDLHLLSSVKDGCSEGACGTCTIVVDGKAVKVLRPDHQAGSGKKHHYHGGIKATRKRKPLCMPSGQWDPCSADSVHWHGDGRKGAD